MWYSLHVPTHAFPPTFPPSGGSKLESGNVDYRLLNVAFPRAEDGQRKFLLNVTVSYQPTRRNVPQADNHLYITSTLLAVEFSDSVLL